MRHLLEALAILGEETSWSHDDAHDAFLAHLDQAAAELVHTDEEQGDENPPEEEPKTAPKPAAPSKSRK